MLNSWKTFTTADWLGWQTANWIAFEWEAPEGTSMNLIRPETRPLIRTMVRSMIGAGPRP